MGLPLEWSAGLVPPQISCFITQSDVEGLEKELEVRPRGPAAPLERGEGGGVAGQRCLRLSPGPW